MNRVIPILLIFSVVAVSAPFAKAQMTTTTTPSQMTGATSLLFDVVTNYYSLDRTTVMHLRDQGWGPTDVAVAANLSVRSGRPFSEVVSLYQSNMSWPDVATRLNVSSTDLYALTTPGMVATGLEVDQFERASIMSEYRLGNSTINTLRSRGFSWGEIRLIANASARTGRPIMEIADLRAQGLTWTDIATRYNVRVSDLTSPPVPSVSRLGAGPRSRTDMRLTMDEYDRLRRLGWNEEEIRVAGMIRARSNATLDEIVRLRSAGLTWFQVAERYNIPFRDVQRARYETTWLP